ncbi:MAG: rod shape-determining protein RodA [candidate division KSB1 bacterium]|nr:rod shape-determining protein RodA [candidate division KSB1 bacterium]
MGHSWRYRLEHLDKPLVVATALLLGLGLVALYSACAQAGDSPWAGNFGRQLGWLALGFVGFVLACVVSLQLLNYLAYFLYGVSVILLVLLLLFGKGPGVARWLALGPVQIQPAELAKVALVLALARFLSDTTTDLDRTVDLLKAFGLALVPMALVAKQPNLGTAMVFGAVLLPMLFWAGLSLSSLFIIVSPMLSFVAAFHKVALVGVLVLVILALVILRASPRKIVLALALNIAAALAAPMLWNQLHDYQQQRILAFLGLKQDPMGLSYQVIQSKVAIGSGGIWGKGLLHGTQTHLRFLPAQHTDFIFSVIGEELGFVGTMAALCLFAFFLYRCLKIATQARNAFASYVVMGVFSVFAWHILVNVGMAVGIMPVTGLPLPFMSYGGSFLLASLIMVGLVANVSMRWDEY